MGRLFLAEQFGPAGGQRRVADDRLDLGMVLPLVPEDDARVTAAPLGRAPSPKSNASLKAGRSRSIRLPDVAGHHQRPEVVALTRLVAADDGLGVQLRRAGGCRRRLLGGLHRRGALDVGEPHHGAFLRFELAEDALHVHPERSVRARRSRGHP